MENQRAFVQTVPPPAVIAFETEKLIRSDYTQVFYFFERKRFNQSSVLFMKICWPSGTIERYLTCHN